MLAADVHVRHFEGPAGAPIEQTVQVQHVTVCGRPWLLVYAEVCATTLYDSATALAHGATLAVGGVCTLDDSYFLQHAVPATTAAADLDLVIDLLAHEAARLRSRSLVPLAPAVSPFTYFAE